jgi:hypothetical protein
MARKKVEPIKNLGDEDKLTVQKSLPLFSLWRSNLTLAEFKILDTYLGRIDSHNSEKRIVTFEKGQLENLLGVKKINNKDLKARLKNLMSNVVEVEDSSTKKGFRLVSLFEEAVAEQDEYGLWEVKLECTQKAMKYFFNVENLGYLRYKLRCITSITSRHTYIMFLYLEANRYRKSWDVSIDELKKILCCDEEETYKEFKHFNNLVLKKVQREMDEKTECQYSYEPIKKGRSVVAVRFTVISKFEIFDSAAGEEIDENQITVDQWIAEKNQEVWQTALENFNFSAEQLEEIRELLLCIPENKLPDDVTKTNDIYFRWTHYLKLKVARMRQRNVKNNFPYLIKTLKNDAGLS